MGFQPRTMISLAEAERLIKKYEIIVPCPSRQTLIRMCEDGTFETPDGGIRRSFWLIYKDSFLKWAGYDSEEMAIAA